MKREGKIINNKENLMFLVKWLRKFWEAYFL